MAALQIARLLGARTIVTSGRRRQARGRAAPGRRRGDQPRGGGRRRRRSAGSPTGGEPTSSWTASARRRWQDSLRALRRGGRLVICGATTGPMIALDLRRLFWHQWSMLGSTLGSRREYAEIVRAGPRGPLWPVVDRVVPLAEAGPRRSARLQRGEQTGKLVIEVAHVNELWERLRIGGAADRRRSCRRWSARRSSC